MLSINQESFSASNYKEANLRIDLLPANTQIQTFSFSPGDLAKSPSISDVLQMTPNCSKETIIKLNKLCLDNVGFVGFEKFPHGFFTPDQELSPELQQLKVNYVCITQ